MARLNFQSLLCASLLAVTEARHIALQGQRGHLHKRQFDVCETTDVVTVTVTDIGTVTVTRSLTNTITNTRTFTDTETIDPIATTTDGGEVGPQPGETTTADVTDIVTTTDIVDATATTTNLVDPTAGPQPAETFDTPAGRYDFVGCFTDVPGDGTPINAEQESAPVSGLPACLNFCATAQGGPFLYANLVIDECFCGRSIDAVTVPGTCDAPCADNPDLICGGGAPTLQRTQKRGAGDSGVVYKLDSSTISSSTIRSTTRSTTRAASVTTTSSAGPEATSDIEDVTTDDSASTTVRSSATTTQSGAVTTSSGATTSPGATTSSGATTSPGATTSSGASSTTSESDPEATSDIDVPISTSAGATTTTRASTTSSSAEEEPSFTSDIEIDSTSEEPIRAQATPFAARVANVAATTTKSSPYKCPTQAAVKNGGFENGSFDSTWSIGFPNHMSTPVRRNADTVGVKAIGSFVLQQTVADGENAMFFQKTAVCASKKYTITAAGSIKANQSGSCQLYLCVNGADNCGKPVVLKSGSLKTASHTFKTGKTTQNVAVQVWTFCPNAVEGRKNTLFTDKVTIDEA